MKYRTGLAGISAPLVALVFAAPLLAAQSGASPTPAAGASTITAERFRQHVEALTNDSIGARTIGSPGLERAARYVAAQFEQMHLQPAASTRAVFHDIAFRRPSSDTLSWFQRYRLPGNLAPVHGMTSMNFLARLKRSDQDVIELTDWPGLGRETKPVERRAEISFDKGAYFGVDTIPESLARGRRSWATPTAMTILTGHHTAATLAAATLDDQEVVLYLPPIGIDSANRKAVVDVLDDSRNVVVLSNEDSTTFARRNERSRASPPVVMNSFMDEVTGQSRWVTYVRADQVAGVLAVAGLDLRQLQEDSTPAVRKAPAMAAWISTRFQDAQRDTTSGVNVIGVLPGTDSILRRDFLIFTAHMDQVEGKGKGADDNASGVAALLSLAEAFSQPGARPKRSLIFAITSGTARGFAGANYFADTESIGYGVPTMLNITLDRLGRAPKDSLFVDGAGDLMFAIPPAWVAAQHPELGLTLVDGGTAMTTKSEHMAFSGRGIPSLFFYGDSTERVGDATDTVEGINAEQAERMLRLIQYTASEVANAAEWPRWSAEGRARRILFLGK